MKAVILAGGLGTRLAEETGLKPKPMVEIGGKPILWHIMKLYSAHGIHDFIICCGYKGYVVKEYFANYFLHQSDVTISLRDNAMQVHQNYAEPWTVTLVDTGVKTATGGRLRRVRPYLKGEETFCFTYGDGLADLDIRALLAFHKAHGCAATLTATRAPGRYGVLGLSPDQCVTRFQEKPEGAAGWINGGFFVLNASVLETIEGDDTQWEGTPLTELADKGQLMAFLHGGFWQAMDTLREKQLLQALWETGEAPWKVWAE